MTWSVRQIYGIRLRTLIMPCALRIPIMNYESRYLCVMKLEPRIVCSTSQLTVRKCSNRRVCYCICTSLTAKRVPPGLFRMEIPRGCRQININTQPSFVIVKPLVSRPFHDPHCFASIASSASRGIIPFIPIARMRLPAGPDKPAWPLNASSRFLARLTFTSL